MELNPKLHDCEVNFSTKQTDKYAPDIDGFQRLNRSKTNEWAENSHTAHGRAYFLLGV